MFFARIAFARGLEERMREVTDTGFFDLEVFLILESDQAPTLRAADAGGPLSEKSDGAGWSCHDTPRELSGPLLTPPWLRIT